MRPGYDDVHLVTGFPGFVARHLATDLLAEEPRALAILAAPGLERFAADPRTLAVKLIENVRFDARRAERLLHPANVFRPPFATYVDNLVEALRDHLCDHLGRAKPRSAGNEGASA